MKKIIFASILLSIIGGFVANSEAKYLYPDGDFNRDCSVNFTDFLNFSRMYGKGNFVSYDLNQNRKIDFEDFTHFSRNYGETCDSNIKIDLHDFIALNPDTFAWDGDRAHYFKNIDLSVKKGEIKDFNFPSKSATLDLTMDMQYYFKSGNDQYEDANVTAKVNIVLPISFSNVSNGTSLRNENNNTIPATVTIEGHASSYPTTARVSQVILFLELDGTLGGWISVSLPGVDGILAGTGRTMQIKPNGNTVK